MNIQTKRIYCAIFVFVVRKQLKVPNNHRIWTTTTTKWKWKWKWILLHHVKMKCMFKTMENYLVLEHTKLTFYSQNSWKNHDDLLVWETKSTRTCCGLCLFKKQTQMSELSFEMGKTSFYMKMYSIKWLLFNF